MLTGIDLFSGIGGLTLALNEWIRPVAYCEIDPYCQAVLISRMADELLPDGPIWNDIRTFPGLSFNGSIDCIYGGFPCQDVSIAGSGKGLDGKQSGLFFEIIRLVKEIRPRFVFLENTPGIRTRGLDKIVEEFTKAWYDCRWTMLCASDVGATHKRERWFLLAHSNSERFTERASQKLQSSRKTIVDEKFSDDQLSDMESWASYARNLRKTDAIPYRMDRIKSLGNSCVPDQAKKAFKILIGLT